MNKPGLIVEGPADKEAVPELIRRFFYSLNVYDVQPASRPIACGGLACIKREGEFEKFVERVMDREDVDSVIALVDCDDDCPKEVVKNLRERTTHLSERYCKPVGIILMKSEFETMFLHCIDDIAMEYGYTPNHTRVYRTHDIDSIRDAKEEFKKTLNVGYKETRDQTRYVHSLDFEKLYNSCRAATHMVDCLSEIKGRVHDDIVHPWRRLHDNVNME